MNGLTYLLRLIEPVLVKNLEGDMNSARSLPFIPGSVVRGAVIAAYLKSKNLKRVNADNTDFRNFFLNGCTRYLHAFPDSDGQRSLPAPLSWKVRKNEADGNEEVPVDIFDFARQEVDEDDLKPFKPVTYMKAGQSVYSTEIPFQLNVHSQRDAVAGRALENRGAIFRFESLPAGLVLRGIILTDKKDIAEELMLLLQNQTMMLGKSRTAGYGMARVEEIRPLDPDWRDEWYWEEEYDDDEYDDESEDEPDAESTPDITEFCVHFHSAALIRDERGQFTLDPRKAFEARLNCLLKEKRIFRKGEIVGGFNRTWGLQLPQVIAIAPGSVFVYEADSPVPQTLLRKLEETGVGERRAEGFGALAVHKYLPDQLKWLKIRPDEKPPDTDGIALNDVERKLAKRMLIRMLRKELDDKLPEAVQKNRIDKEIPNSQISRWRTIIRSESGKNEPEITVSRVKSFYENMDRNSPSWHALHRARTGEGKIRLTKWLKDVLSGENSPWKQMKYVKAPSRKLGSVTVSADFLAAEYKLRLIDAVLADSAKRNRRES